MNWKKRSGRRFLISDGSEILFYGKPLFWDSSLNSKVASFSFPLIPLFFENKGIRKDGIVFAFLLRLLFENKVFYTPTVKNRNFVPEH